MRPDLPFKLDALVSDGRRSLVARLGADDRDVGTGSGMSPGDLCYSEPK